MANSSSSPTQRTVIASATGRKGMTALDAERVRLEQLYLKVHQRRLPVDLFLGSRGTPPNSVSELTAHWNNEDYFAVEFLKENATPRQIAA